MSLNIGGSDDAFFRYKMPDIEVKIEGRGNGIKTVIPNMADIGQALKRDPTYPTKFFATELGALSKWDDKRNLGIVNGEHSKETLTKLLADFINRYVLCPQCKLPETDLKVKGGVIMAKCKACGFRGPSDNQHKLATFIVNHPPNKDEKDKKAADKSKKEKRKEKTKEPATAVATSKTSSTPSKEAKKENSPAVEQAGNQGPKADDDDGGEDSGKGSQEGDAEEEDEGEIKFEITEEMRTMHIDKEAELDDPVELMAKLLASVANENLDSQLTRIRTHQKEEAYDNAHTFQYALKAIVTDAMAKQTKANISLLKKLITVDRDSQLLLLSLLEERCESFPENLKDVSATLMLLYDKEMLEEDVICVWHEKGISQLIALADQKASEATRKAADKFVEWLHTAEEEGSDEE